MSISKVVRREFLTCRLSREEKNIIVNNAELAKQDISTYVRETLTCNNKINLPKSSE